MFDGMVWKGKLKLMHEENVPLVTECCGGWKWRWTCGCWQILF